MKLPIYYLTAMLPSVMMANPSHRVAYDDAGEVNQQVHLISGENWMFQTPGLATAEEQSVVFGDVVKFAYAKVNPQAEYEVRLTFFADEARVVCVKCGEVVLGQVEMEKHKPKKASFRLPAGGIKDQQILLSIEKVSGANAVVSEVEILSSVPGVLEALPAGQRGQLTSSYTMDQVPVLRPLPASVSGVKQAKISLAGTWKFYPSLAESGTIEGITKDLSGWKDIRVPGEWSMQGFKVEAKQRGVYLRKIDIPQDWNGHSIFLRCEGVYSDSCVYLNGKLLGKHSGGFTPFDIELTEAAKVGTNELVITAVNETTADMLAAGSRYACHALGGISRHLYLYPLPKNALQDLAVSTTFDSRFENAKLHILAKTQHQGATIRASLKRIEKGKVTTTVFKDRQIQVGGDHVDVLKPAQWNPENPNLYLLTMEVSQGGAVMETVEQKIGFKQVDVRENRLYVNGKVVKLRASNHHEVYPLTGRSTPDGVDRRDVELFREGNVNLLRTCHYPPNRELVEAADELGMFIESEAPFCWAPGKGHDEIVCNQTAEMVKAYRNNASILFWSLANESQWGAHFEQSSRIVRLLDPTRPQTFNWMTPKLQFVEEGFTEIANIHYPTHNGPEQARQYTKRPVYLGEDTHLNAYNRLELATDPALRDLWGRYLREMWDDVYQTPGCLGNAIWSGVDDTFYMGDDQTVGYGTWGPIDGWRRTKPEWWNMKKGYSPIRLGEPVIREQSIQFSVDNRYHFTDLAEVKVLWKTDTAKGELKLQSIAPGTQALIEVPVQGAKFVELKWIDPRGFVADEFRIPLQAKSAAAPRSGTCDYQLDEATGMIKSLQGLPVAGPQLMVLALNSEGETQMTGKTKVWKPFTQPCGNWKLESIDRSTDKQVVTVKGAYDEAKGSYTLRNEGDTLVIQYQFEVTKDINPRQIGLVFGLPGEYETLTWQRDGYWNVYPDDHIARLQGTVKASEGVEATSVGPRVEPKHPWRLDRLPYGNNDFCSTKHQVITGSLTEDGGKGIEVDGAGKQHLRAWKVDGKVNFLVADYSNGGSERFLRGLAKKDDRPLKAGQKVSGVVRLRAKK